MNKPTPPTYEQIIEKTLSAAEIKRFMADNQFKRDQEWARKNKREVPDLFRPS